MTERITIVRAADGEPVTKEYDRIQINSAGMFVCTPTESDVEGTQFEGLDGSTERKTPADVYPPQTVERASIGSKLKALGLDEY